MSRIVVVGSGASAVHFAWTALERGNEVLVVDVGREGPGPVRPGDSYEELKHNLDDPVEHLLGERYEAVTYPGEEGEYYGFPPNKSHVFEEPAALGVRTSGFAPLVSFARGGLAEAWTGGVFPFNDGELRDFPFSPRELDGAYDVVAGRIGITGTEDDLARHHPVHRHLLPPLPLDEHSRLLLRRYEASREVFRKLGCVVGRSRVAVLPDDRGGRTACALLGRCLLGCPTESLYTPSITLRELLGRPGFTYRPGLRARHFRIEEGRVTALLAERLDGSGEEEIPVERLVLGAGTLASTRIFLESWRRATGRFLRLAGLMDNRQVLVPFLNLRMIRRPYDPASYQYHQLALGLEADDPRDYVHGLITTLTTASIHPIVSSVPFDLRTSLDIFRNVHAALGLVNVNFPDRRRDSCWVSLEGRRPGPGTDSGGAGGQGEPALVVHYEPPRGERALLARTLRRLRRALRRLGCVVPPGTSHVRPMGASVHYAGTLPMTEEERPLTTTPGGRSRELENLWFVDGTTFPFLPAKNLTFTLMANAVRIAGREF